MAASITKVLTQTGLLSRSACNACKKKTGVPFSKNGPLSFNYERNFSGFGWRDQHFSRNFIGRSAYITAGFATIVGVSFYVGKFTSKARAHSTQKPQHKPLRSIKSETDSSGLKLTLYQYQTCPFCTKVRTYLDYMGLSYDVVEVNSVWRTEMKWSKYKKVPVLLVDGVGDDGFLQLNDSSVIISILESYLRDRSQDIQQLVSYFPQMKVQNDRGKTVFEFPNRYNVVYSDPSEELSAKALREQRKELKWRRWADEWLVHTLSPNIYRTPREALQAFRYFDEVGEWNKVFSAAERSVIIYVGACAMWLLGKKLRRKYDLDENVRLSLYGACNEWASIVRRHRGKGEFLGGSKPNLADLAVYGTLNAIEGCSAFADVLEHTDVGPWYEATKLAVSSHMGASPENAKP